MGRPRLVFNSPGQAILINGGKVNDSIGDEHELDPRPTVQRVRDSLDGRKKGVRWTAPLSICGGRQ